MSKRLDRVADAGGLLFLLGVALLFVSYAEVSHATMQMIGWRLLIAGPIILLFACFAKAGIEVYREQKTK